MRKTIFLTLTLFFFVGVIIVLTSPEINLPPSLPQKETPKSATEKPPSKKDFSKLRESYNQILSRTRLPDGQAQSEFSVTFLDLNSREKFSINGEKSFHAASTSKPIVAAYALTQVDYGKISLGKEIWGLPLSERIRLMINISDNDSWEALLNFFGIARVQGFSRSLGLSATSHVTNTSTTDDLSLFLLKIYQDSILSEDKKELLLRYMQNTEREDRIPAGIIQKKLVFHKSGTYGGEIHDIGIIEHPKNPFILAILSNGQNDLSRRPAILAEFAKVSWDFADSN